MTDTVLAPARVTITPTDLFEAACVALENETVQRCIGKLRAENLDGTVMHCAEGVIAQVLINADPARFQWNAIGQMVDRERHRTVSMLESEHWNLLHRHGFFIANETAAAFGRGSIAGINDHEKASFSDIATQLRAARTRVESWGMR